MKHILRKLHIGGSHDTFDGRPHLDGRAHVVGALASADSALQSDSPSSSSSPPSFAADQRVPSGFSGWLTNARHSLLPSNGTPRSRLESAGAGAESATSPRPESDPVAGSPIDFKYYEEEYQVQLALALSVSNQNVLDDPESLQIRAAKRISLGRPPSPGSSVGDFSAHRYWTYSVLDYEEKVVDGFYDVYSVVSDFGTSEKMPSLGDLQGTPLTDSLGYEVVLVNRTIDAHLVRLEQAALCLAIDCGAGEFGPQQSGLVQKIADLVVGHMGGPVVDANDMLRRWRTRSYELRTSLNNIVLPLGCLQIGLSRHRALLFKVLADHVGIPCRLVKGSHYTGTDEGAVNIVKMDNEREYIVDLMGAPGTLLPAESVGATGHLDIFENTSLVEELFSQMDNAHNSSGNVVRENEAGDKTNQSLGALVRGDKSSSCAHKGCARFDDSGREGAASHLDGMASSQLQQGQWMQSSSLQGAGSHPSSSEVKDISQYFIGSAKENPQLGQKLHDAFLENGVVARQDLFTGNFLEQSQVNPTFYPSGGGAKAIEPSIRVPITAAEVATAVVLGASAAVRISFQGRFAANPSSSKDNRDERNSKCYDVHFNDKIVSNEDLSSGDRCYINRWAEHVINKGDPVLENAAEWEIPWEEIVIGERIGLGSYGEVHHGDWHGREVAVKRFLDQDFSGDALDEFISEVRIMRRMQHPNVVLFIGAVTRPPNLSIVTEYLPRGSLFRLLHRPNCQLDERRRLKMALDVAEGMNYLHTSMPIIVHRDLKSPNLLVDKSWVVKVCDFGLSRMKHHTFLSSKSTAGTPEWMAPEVLRNEPSNEKCDVYSFGVILWELATLQQPWSGMNPMQVVGAVGFQNRRLELPVNLEPSVARIIWDCWQSDSGLRPSFSELLIALKPLQRLLRD